jgi:hypothetical protein
VNPPEPHGGSCCVLAFGKALSVPPGAQLALEDYARTLAKADAATVLTAADPSRIEGVHLCGVRAAPDESVREDVEAFARELVAHPGDGLGWS